MSIEVLIEMLSEKAAEANRQAENWEGVWDDYSVAPRMQEARFNGMAEAYEGLIEDLKAML